MKKFLYRIITFSIIVLLLAIAIDIGFSRLLMRSNDRRFEAWYDLMHGQIDADVIVTGSSRSWVHISPMILDSILNTSTYNLGIDGSSINRQVRKYRLFRKNNRPPKLIIQNIDRGSLTYRIGYEREQFFPYFWNSSMRKEFYDMEPISFAEKYLPLVRYEGMYKLSLLESQPKFLERGYKGLDRNWDGEIFNTIDSLTFSYDKSCLVLFDDFLKEVTDEGIKVLFVYTPIYIGATYKMMNLDEMRAFYQKIADKYNIPILDYTYMDICSDTTYFYNAMHLNRKGAEIFSDSLANDIKRLRILK